MAMLRHDNVVPPNAAATTRLSAKSGPTTITVVRIRVGHGMCPDDVGVGGSTAA